MVKFPIPWGIKAIYGEHVTSRSCYRSNFRAKQVAPLEIQVIHKASTLGSRKNETSALDLWDVATTSKAIPLQTASSYVEPQMENFGKVQIDPDFLNRVTFIGAHSASPLWEEIIAILMEHRVVIFWYDWDWSLHHNSSAASGPEFHLDKAKEKKVLSWARCHHWWRGTKIIRDRVDQMCIDFTESKQSMFEGSFPSHSYRYPRECNEGA